MSINVTIDIERINKKLFASEAFLRKSLPAAKRKFNSILNLSKAELLAEFDSNPITMEIEAGPKAANTSGLLGGYGSLFSYIGFENGRRPITKVRNLLLKIEAREPIFDQKRRVWEFRVIIPDKKAIASVSELEWLGGSWIEELEKGMTNLGSYRYNKNGIQSGDSRSGTGIQTDAVWNNNSGIVRADYLNKMLANFRKNLKG